MRTHTKAQKPSHTHTDKHTHIETHTHTDTHTDTHTHTNTHTNTHTHTQTHPHRVDVCRENREAEGEKEVGLEVGVRKRHGETLTCSYPLSFVLLADTTR